MTFTQKFCNNIFLLLLVSLLLFYKQKKVFICKSMFVQKLHLEGVALNTPIITFLWLTTNKLDNNGIYALIDNLCID